MTLPDGARRRRGRLRGDLTVATIAQLAGVSPPTVSKVLNGRAGVGPSTRTRVEALLRDHGYRRPDPATTSRCLEVVFYAMLSSIAIELLRGIEEVAGARDLTVGFTDVYRRARAGQPWVEPLLVRRPAGLITVFSGISAEHRGLQARADLRHNPAPAALARGSLEASGIPLVAVDPTGEMHPIPSVGSTNWRGALDATRHLLDLGHRRIGVITGPVKDLSSRARLDGFRAALDTADVPFDERLMRTGLFLFEHGRDLGLELLRLPDPPTAIVCGDDLQALGVYEAARLAGRRIPAELSVVGFDDIEQCAWCGPPMTTVRQPFAEMGATAARMVVELAAGRRPAQTRIELGTSLVVRGSTAPPP
jgi:LacI family transcriptional regulator, xylobiose transport system transcriptional regulator